MLEKLWPALAWALVIIILMLFPGNMLPEARSQWNFLFSDKIIHAFLFFVLTFLLMRGFLIQHKCRFLRSNYILVAVFVGIVFGGMTELLQALTESGRSASAYDFIADATGCIIAWPVVIRIKDKLM
ncbi:MAG: VanZ family protein [Bacteroidota bacterium]